MEQNNQDRYKMVIGESHVTTDDAFVAADVKAILDKHFEENNNVEVYKRCFNAIDLTTLNSTDTVSSVTKFVTRVNDFETEYPELPNVAAICVYPNFAMVVSGA
ncbi:MAG: deoxyribose-phosphate aldolase, partial [Muribaculaceae bacterium]|nr:deoxyribose-phosphate aldolase [Muribaculaceae bacterium]